MVSRPTRGGWFDAFKSPLAQIQFINEDINNPYRIGICNVVIKQFRKPCALGSALALYETLHRPSPVLCLKHRQQNVC